MLRRAIDTRLEWLLLVSVAVLMVGGPARLYGQSAGEPDIAPLWIKKDTFGTVNASVGDLNADGFDDAAILGTERGSNRDGPVCILFGSPHGLEDNCEQSVNPPPTSVDSVAGLGDVNGDGHADIIVGAPDQQGGRILEPAPSTHILGTTMVSRVRMNGRRPAPRPIQTTSVEPSPERETSMATDMTTYSSGTPDSLPRNFA